MKIQYCSDLHLEFPENKNYLKNFPLIPQGEILLLAGDILPFVLLDKPSDFVNWAADNFEQVFWIPGNHEYYHYDIAKKDFALNEKIRSNFSLVNNVQIVLNDINFIFSTLWSDISMVNAWLIQRNMSDFSLIKINNRYFGPSDFSNLHRKCFSFLEGAVRRNTHQKTIIVTHHVPTLMNYPPKYKLDILNEAFAVELFDFIEDSNADYWLYGHHHANILEFNIGKTKLITNQLGYVTMGENKTFRREAIIEL